MKLLIKLSSLFCILILSWCWGGIEEQTINFDNFSVNIPEIFEEKTKPSTIENKQILGKILKAYKEKKEQNEFENNFIISKTELKSKIKSSEFNKINSSKLQKQIAWYSLLNNEQSQFECKGEEINYFIHSFSLPEKIFENKNTFYIIQSYFSYWKNWYILSFATKNKDKISEFKKQLKTIKCK